MSDSQIGTDKDLRRNIEDVLESLMIEPFGTPLWVESYRITKALVNGNNLAADLQRKCVEVLAILPEANPSKILAIQTGLVDLVSPLSEYCESVASSSPIKYRIQKEILRDDEIFAPDCTLPIFLFLAKKFASAKMGLRIHHYHDSMAVLDVVPIVPAKPDSRLFDDWKQCLHRRIASLEAAAREGYVDLYQHYAEWWQFTNNRKTFSGWHLLINHVRENVYSDHDE